MFNFNIMWMKMLILTFAINTVCFADYLAAQKNDKRKRSLSNPRLKKLREHYEMKHFAMYYDTNKEEYTKWHILKKNESVGEFCAKFLEKLFPVKSMSGTTGSLLKTGVMLEYQEIRDQNGSKYNPFNVAAVNCRPPTNGHRRNFILSESPEPNCMYLLDYEIEEKHYLLHISVKLCLPHEEQNMHGIEDDAVQAQKEILGSRFKRAVMKLSPQKREKLEYNHMMHYQTNREPYLHWPELNAKDKMKYCRDYLKLPFPFSNLTPHDISVNSCVGILRYKHIPSLGSESTSMADVKILECTNLRAQKYKARSHFHITNAPECDCVYLLNLYKEINQSGFFIVSKHCYFEIPSVTTNPNTNSQYYDYSNDISSKPVEEK